jgi:hypothetical protein
MGLLYLKRLARALQQRSLVMGTWKPAAVLGAVAFVLVSFLAPAGLLAWDQFPPCPDAIPGEPATAKGWLVLTDQMGSLLWGALERGLFFSLMSAMAVVGLPFAAAGLVLAASDLPRKLHRSH